jgi:hypothetical protein
VIAAVLVAAGVVYVAIAGVMAAVVAHAIDDSPADNPLPIFGGLLWPLTLACFALGGVYNATHRSLRARAERKQLPEARTVDR